jgi:hypothetical protein
MFIVPVVLSVIFCIAVKILKLQEDILIIGLSGCWITYFSIIIFYIIRDPLGWWMTVIC